MNKVYWRIRLDTWLGYTLNKLSAGKLSGLIKLWYDHKYEMNTGDIELDDLPPYLQLGDGFFNNFSVKVWVKVEGIALPVAVIDSPIAGAFVMINANLSDDYGDGKTASFIVMTDQLPYIAKEDEVIAILEHEMRHFNRHWWILGLYAKAVARATMSNNPRTSLRVLSIIMCPILWIMELDADRVTKEHRHHLASGLSKIYEDIGAVGRLVGTCITHPPFVVRSFLLK